MLTALTRTHPGRVRDNNEDVALWDPDVSVLALADGMGGHNAGEVASQLAVETLHAFLRQGLTNPQIRWPFGFDDTASRVHNLLRTAVKLANREVFRTAHERSACAGMGTTLTSAIADGSRVTLSSVGDSRLYLFRGSELTQVTRDDSLVGALSGVAGLDPQVLDHHPMRHLLTSVIGRGLEIDVTVHDLEIIGDDLLLLSSDGLHGEVSNASIQEILRGETDLHHAADRLLDLALAAGGRDNITIVLARYTTNDR